MNSQNVMKTDDFRIFSFFLSFNCVIFTFKGNYISAV